MILRLLVLRGPFLVARDLIEVPPNYGHSACLRGYCQRFYEFHQLQSDVGDPFACQQLLWPRLTLVYRSRSAAALCG